ncbi:hypothetical protein BCR33DRAFT_720503 [Rhizoclosmatium globosum]|uniref:Extracellular membrane protein CFEM domain-containing protein n=1 Tax=Rhizoclosmatium globosum TaxID=329046 RepID=A0A1Y2BVR0_9FUNG|nr:hypothetical protein BCR33DRAFT_720503 [Rhizoclosmatium globosum]|eukprot:ORY38836.1 hypothetical protein BCR33DRAFT_720503 [Rhizoclosmatium globosum]
MHQCFTVLVLSLCACAVVASNSKAQASPAADPEALVNGFASAAGSLETIITSTASQNCVNNCLNKMPALNVSSPASVKAFCGNTEVINSCKSACAGSALLANLNAECSSLVSATACQAQCLNQIPQVNITSMESVASFCNNKMLLSVCQSACPNSNLLSAILGYCASIAPNPNQSPLPTAREPSNSAGYRIVHWTAFLALLGSIFLLLN